MRTTIDLFAGAGGASLGLRNAGMQHELCIEWQECAVLQGFPGDYPFVGRTKASLYRQVGNAVCPVVSEVLGRCVMKAMDT